MKLLLALSVLAVGCAPKCVINNPVKTDWVTLSPKDETDIMLNFCDDGRVLWTHGTSKPRKP